MGLLYEEELMRSVRDLVEKVKRSPSVSKRLTALIDELTEKMFPISESEFNAKADLVDGKVPATQLPSYVDDIEEYDSLSEFPTTGEGGKLYVAKDTNYTYRWGGSSYVLVTTNLLVYQNVTADNWVVDDTYDGFGYKCVLTCTGITANSIVEVIFDNDEAVSGNYAPVCLTNTNTVTIFSKVDTAITIPVIKEI